jgi:hypothetical protein
MHVGELGRREQKVGKDEEQNEQQEVLTELRGLELVI